MSPETIYYLIAGGVLGLILLVWGIYRYRTRHIVVWWHEDEDEAPLMPVSLPVTAVVISANDGVAIERNIPELLEQRGVNLEVVVVDAATTDSTSDAIKRLQHRYPELRKTYIPATHAALDLRDLAAVLGAKSARNEWLVIMHGDFCPPSSDWLLDLLQYADDSLCAVIDYARVSHEYDDEPGRMARLRQGRKMARTAMRGRAMDAAGGSVLIKKEWLLASAGRQSEAEAECLYVYQQQAIWDRLILRARTRLPGACRW